MRRVVRTHGARRLPLFDVVPPTVYVLWTDRPTEPTCYCTRGNGTTPTLADAHRYPFAEACAIARFDDYDLKITLVDAHACARLRLDSARAIADALAAGTLTPVEVPADAPDRS